MNRRQLALFNWCSLFACGMAFAVGGTIAGLACIVLAEHLAPALISLALCVALYLLAARAFWMMERYA